MIGSNTDKAVAFSKEGLNLINAEISSMVSTQQFLCLDVLILVAINSLKPLTLISFLQ